MQSIALNNRRILIVDDNLSIHDDYRKILARSTSESSLDELESLFFGEVEPQKDEVSFELDFADQGQIALSLVEKSMQNGTPYAMAFVDMRMPPGWDGLRTIEEIWKVDPQLEIVIATAYSDASWSEILDRLGCTDNLLILKKPFDNVEVSQLATALTEKWKLRRIAQVKQDELEAEVEKRTAELREKDRQLMHAQRMEAVGTLASGVAHEFNNLLHAIRGYTSFAQGRLEEGHAAHADLELVFNASDHAAVLTRQLLDYSRTGTDDLTIVDVGETVSNLVKMLRPILGKDVEVQSQIPEQSELFVLASRVYLSQAIMNLCVNARDAMNASGRLTLTLSRKAGVDNQNDQIVITVADSGGGIPDEIREKIFDPFFTTKAPGKGTGLGLAMVFNTIKKLGGSIEIDSVVGEGTTFTLTLPAAAAPDKENSLDNCDAHSPRTILFADDDEISRMIAVNAMESAGHHVFEASDGQEAIKQFLMHRDEVELLVLDAEMPEKSGLNAYREITAAGFELPLILCTGHSAATLEAALPENAILIQKPFSPEKLNHAIQKATADQVSNHLVSPTIK